MAPVNDDKKPTGESMDEAKAVPVESTNEKVCEKVVFLVKL